MIEGHALAVGSHTAGATAVTIYTVPAGTRAKLVELAVFSTVADTLVVSTISAAGVPARLVYPDPVLAAGGSQIDVLRRWLEPGDTVSIAAILAANTVRWWLSGTLYTS